MSETRLATFGLVGAVLGGIVGLFFLNPAITAAIGLAAGVGVAMSSGGTERR